MLLSALLPQNTPAWIRLAVEVAVLLVAACFLLGALRRGRIGALVLVAWVWFFWPPGHAWMLAAWHTALTDGRALVPTLLGQVKAAASQSAQALASTAVKPGR